MLLFSGHIPCDWVWLVPPLSGGATPVFHQEMVLPWPCLVVTFHSLISDCFGRSIIIFAPISNIRATRGQRITGDSTNSDRNAHGASSKLLCAWLDCLFDSTPPGYQRYHSSTFQSI